MFEAMDESSVSARQLLTQSGADPGGGMGPHAPPLFGADQALNAEVYRALST